MIPRAAALAVAVVAGACAPASAQESAPTLPPAAGALAPAQLYRDGRRDEAVALLENSSEGALQAELETLRFLKDAPDPSAVALLRASLLVHTDRAALERATRAGGGRRCGLNHHDTFARSVAKLMLARPEGRAFVRRWFVAMALASQRDLCGLDLAVWTRAGLDWFPKETALLLARGTAAETEGAFAHTLDFATLDRGDENAQRQRAERALEIARTSLHRAVELDPALHEARLRLGRTLWRLQERNDALAHLERVARAAPTPQVAYLSHLFLARVYEDGARAADAARAYRAALAAEPAGQAAAIGLAQLQARTAGIAASRALVESALAHAPRREPRDPYWSYPGAFAGGGEKELAALRAEVSR